jgi:hypothetical protein
MARTGFMKTMEGRRRFTFSILLFTMLWLTQCHAQQDSIIALEISNTKIQKVTFRRDTLSIDTTSRGFQFYRDSTNLILLDSATALAVAEAILFNVYGRENVVLQRPYTIHRRNFYWELSGTLAPKMRGGVFEIVLDARDGRVVYLTHGK